MRRIPWRWLGAVVAMLAVAAAGAAGWAYRAYQNALQPPRPGSTQAVVVRVPRGASSVEIAELLYRRGLIRDPLAFRVLARLQGRDGELRAGVYRLSPGMPAAAILDKLARGEILTARFTIPEGWTVAQVADHLDRQGLVDRQAFRAALDRAAATWPYLPRDPKARAALKEPLEGYLIPDTYRVPVDESGRADPALVVRMMLDRFRQVFGEGEEERARRLGLTVHQAVTLASIVEREARVADERPVIAAVYLNRLERGMSLDADPTVLYALGRTSGTLTYRDLRTDSPYNTYRYPGLPPGPIGAPGRAALQAVLQPADVDYLYFVLSPDGSGRHRFARTLAEHNRNVQAYRQSLQDRDG
ncbi:aminodeoxychorismate lyase [Thermaerobacter marianensis DSM 12885]|uniref:Endolytic murein transglycosylase n=1 Tax=Thermaerobacter marianensis (strain ATCC 700841 / DSM 12885 / JCM 10246 / 7p75a) TaxID=644966 RepID=E6SLA0_THEM7|nr:endolytic transglycosylase MltG [Thermaerobacter marianensis]ADU51331.1 aminodeoxychorismate lyase [Thermaerobacter marianensis DSM 12885]